MAGRGAREFGELGKKKAKIENLGDEAWGLPLSSFLRRAAVMAVEGVSGTAERAAGEEEAAALELSQDPLVVFCDGVMMVILGKLDLRSIAVSRVVSNRWLVVASADKLWGPKCQELWLGKAHIPRISKVRGLSQMKATSLSIMDGKRAAPAYWRDLDPYWGAAGAPMRRYFHHDGSITADPDDKVWGGHESSYTVVTGLLANGKIRQHYVRINRWPQMSVQRNSDWSWVLSNHLYSYSSIPDAEKEGGTGPFSPMF